MKIFSGSASIDLTQRACAHLYEVMGQATVGQFSDGEVKIHIHENIRGKDVFIINSTAPPINRNLMELLILIDAADGVGDQDARVTDLVLERGCAAVIVLNRWDLVDAEQGEVVRNEVAHALRFASHYPVISLSALTGARLGRLWPALAQVDAAAQRRIPTGELNRWLTETVAKHEPSMARRGPRRRPIKFFYATQTGTRPPTFVLFCTEPRSILPSYKRFLENRLRERFDFAGTPIKLRFRARNKD